jgi:hypothetical protein
MRFFFSKKRIQANSEATYIKNFLDDAELLHLISALLPEAIGARPPGTARRTLTIGKQVNRNEVPLKF